MGPEAAANLKLDNDYIYQIEQSIKTSAGSIFKRSASGVVMLSGIRARVGAPGPSKITSPLAIPPLVLFDEVAGKGLARRDEIYPLIASLIRAPIRRSRKDKFANSPPAPSSTPSAMRSSSAEPAPAKPICASKTNLSRSLRTGNLAPPMR